MGLSLGDRSVAQVPKQCHPTKLCARSAYLWMSEAAGAVCIIWGTCGWLPAAGLLPEATLACKDDGGSLAMGSIEGVGPGDLARTIQFIHAGGQYVSETASSCQKLLVA